MDKIEVFLKKHVDGLKNMIADLNAQVDRLLVVPFDQKKPEAAAEVAIKKTKIALIVGHSHESQGAVNYLGETEFSFNSRIAARVEKLFLERDSIVDLKVFFRPDGVVPTAIKKVGKAVGEWGAEASVELHFNSFKTEASGCEALVLRGGGFVPIETDFLTCFFDKFHKDFGIKRRGLKIVEKGESGFLNLKAVKDNGVKMAFLFEPCFGNFKTKESQAVFENEEKYARFLCDQLIALAKTLN